MWLTNAWILLTHLQEETSQITEEGCPIRLSAEGFREIARMKKRGR